MSNPAMDRRAGMHEDEKGAGTGLNVAFSGMPSARKKDRIREGEKNLRKVPPW